MEIENIGRYKVKSELGRGGMATVYDAYDPSFERDVAIKVLPHAFLHDPQFRTRFEREAKMIASLEHPAIVPVYDFGEQDGQPYIVMRYMAGGSLADRLQSGAMSLEETARIVSRLAPALDAAHARGIIHRDLKPGNILFDRYGNAFLSDFGIARLVQTETATLTGTGIVGTPAYMSPEQVRGEREIDGRSDIYALGILVYQMLTGSQPYRAETPAKVMMMHVLDPVPDISTARAEIPPALTSVLQKALAKNPDDRYTTTAEMAMSLESSVRMVGVDYIPQSSPSDPTIVGGQTVHKRSQTPSQTATMVSNPTPYPTPPPSSMPPAPAVEKKRSIPWVWIAIGIIALLGGSAAVIGGITIYGMRQNGPFAIAPTDTVAELAQVLDTATPTLISTTPASALIANTSTPTLVPPTETAQPSPTNTETPIPTETPTEAPQIPIIGGSDQIALIIENEVWSANVDGSNLKQLTTDGAQKTYLNWAPDGSALTYISGKCVYKIDYISGSVDIVTCINAVDSLKAFDISPDSSQVAISLDNQLYILPYDLDRLAGVEIRENLTEIADCKFLAPYERNFITGVRWSADGTTIAARLLGVLANGSRGDIIQIFRVDDCIENPRALDNFPAQRFSVEGYDTNPEIQNYSWDGNFLFLFTNSVRNDGFGELYVYNSELHKAELGLDPIDNQCCYRDASWSPDGSHFAIAFQNIAGGANASTQIYIIPYGSLGTGASYTPLPLPDITDPRAKPRPVLRPANQ